ncbi:MAG: hypothetical protein ACJA0C_000030 [Candidatus Endobugula sp.]|jgi:hypothetical protein
MMILMQKALREHFKKQKIANPITRAVDCFEVLLFLRGEDEEKS